MAETIKIGKGWVSIPPLVIRVRSDPMSDGHYVFLLTEKHQVTQLVLEPRKEGEVLTPLMTVPGAGAVVLQDLFNDLWRIGFRPADGTGNAGHLEAIQGHLDDMRRIAFRKLGIEL